jgi:hypothetical protein
MLKRFVLAFAILAVALATAGTVPGSHTYTITIVQPTVVNGTQLKPGEYRLLVDVTKVELKKGKDSIELQNAKVENGDTKFDTTAIRYMGDKLAEIRIGGTKTRVVIAQ